MWDFTAYELKDLFKIRDACIILKDFNLEDEYMLEAVNNEIKLRIE